MKLNLTLKMKMSLAAVAFAILTTSNITTAQTTAALGNPVNYIYGLTGNGEILEINSTTAATFRVIKNNSYTGNSPSKANGLAYNAVNKKFYYFKRNVGQSNQEFVSFEYTTNTVTKLAVSTCADEVHTACISFDGKGYYTIDTKGNLNYYDILTNTWKTITSNIVDQYNNNVTSVIQSQSAGDIAMDGFGNIWVLTSSNSNYGLYKIPYPAPVNVTAKLTVQRLIAPTATTPNGNSFAGIAFNATGQIFMGTRGDDRLYLLQSNLSLYYIAKFSTSDAGNDLTSQNFPLDVLPVKWQSFTATNNNQSVSLNWEVSELQNRGFYVQHSANGNNWEELTFIKSKGINESVQHYAYSYTENNSGKHYYRIKQQDIDGKESFSEIKMITIKTNVNSAIAVWPNPASAAINISNDQMGAENLTKMQVIDLAGKVNMQLQLQKGKNSIDISSLAKGTYMIKMVSNDNTAYTQKFVKL